MRMILFIFQVILSAQSLSAAKYVPASELLPLIRRDLLPLDIDAIQELAEHLAILADGPLPTSPKMARNRIQTLTLSQRLAPARPQTLAILEALQSGKNRPQPPEKEQKEAITELLEISDWLAKLPAETEGHNLGQLLLDILQPIAENEPPLKLRTTKNAPQRWQGIVAKTDAFKVPEKTPQQALPQKTEPVPPPAIVEKPPYAVTALLTEIPMITKKKKEDRLGTLSLIKTSLVITQLDQPRKLHLQPDPGFAVDSIHTALQKFFRKIDQPLPSKGKLNINTDSRVYLAENGKNIVAPIAMMLDAAVSGRPIRKNTILFADLQSSGSLTKPAKTWELLLELAELRTPNGTRLIVGSGMLEEMTGLLVLEKVGFFTKYEVIEASTFQAARELFYDDGNPAPDLAAAIEGYQKICDKANIATNLTTFLSLAVVEERLIETRDLSPQHLSAHMLAAQAIRRPAYFTRFMFAQELDRRLEKLSTFKYPDDKASDRSLKDAYKEARESVDPLARRLERAESQLLDTALDLIKELNSIGRGSSDDQDGGIQQRKKDLATFQEKLQIFRDSLRLIYQPSQKE